MMADRSKSFLKIGIAIFALVVGAMVAVLWLRPSFVPPPLPVPNGYDDVIQAAEKIAPRTGFYDEMAVEELASVVAQNEPALAMVREALQKDFGVPIDWSGDLSAMVDSEMLDQIQEFRTVGRALAADMRQKTATQNYKAAVDSGITAFHLGNECGRGGLLVHYLVGLAVQTQAIEELRRVVAEEPTIATAIFSGLTPLLDSGESADDVVQRETASIRQRSRRSISGFITYIGAGHLIEPALEAARQAEQRTKAIQRLFVVHLAIRAYREAHGNWPDALSDLSPKYLPIVPLDPYSKQPFVYRAENKGYRLYSVGENGKDDRGDGDETGQELDVVYDLLEELP